MRKFLALEDNDVGAVVFLGGTTKDSTWRDKLIPKLTVSYFNPVVENWTEEHRQIEEQAKNTALIHVYVITPKHVGSYSFVEMCVSALTSSNKKTFIVFLNEDDGVVISEDRQHSHNATIKLLKETTNKETVQFFDNLDTLAEAINRTTF